MYFLRPGLLCPAWFKFIGVGLNMTALEQFDDDGLARALQASRSLEDAPEAAIRRAIDLWPARARAAKVPSAWQRLTAVLRFDSAGQDALALGLRGASGGAALGVRQWLFTAGEHDVDLRAAAVEGDRRWTLNGQVLGPQTAGTASLYRFGDAAGAGSNGGEGGEGGEVGERPADADAICTVAWNEWAEFHFDDLPPGVYQVRLRGADADGDGELTLPPVHVGV